MLLIIAYEAMPSNPFLWISAEPTMSLGICQARYSAITAMMVATDPKGGVNNAQRQVLATFPVLNAFESLYEERRLDAN